MTRPALAGGSAAPVQRPSTVAVAPSPRLTVALASRSHCWAPVLGEAWTLSATTSPVNDTGALLLRYAVAVPPGVPDAGGGAARGEVKAGLVCGGGTDEPAEPGPEPVHPARATAAPAAAPATIAGQRLIVTPLSRRQRYKPRRRTWPTGCRARVERADPGSGGPANGQERASLIASAERTSLPWVPVTVA